MLARRAQPWLGTLVEVSLDLPDEHAFQSAFSRIADIHRHMSYHSDDSDLGLLRRAKPGTIVKVSPDTVAVLKLAKWLFEETNGLLDVTIGRKLVATGYLPKMDPRHLSQFNGNSDDIEIIDSMHVCCHRPTLIDLGGIAKGYAVDSAIAELIAQDKTYALVNAGGDLRHVGTEPETIGLRRADGVVSHELEIGNVAVATSSNLLFRRKHRGQAVSPHIGYDLKPILVDTAIVVLASECVFADAMTKVAMVDPMCAERILNSVNGYFFTIPIREGAV